MIVRQGHVGAGFFAKLFIKPWVHDSRSLYPSKSLRVQTPCHFKLEHQGSDSLQTQRADGLWNIETKRQQQNAFDEERPLQDCWSVNFKYRDHKDLECLPHPPPLSSTWYPCNSHVHRSWLENPPSRLSLRVTKADFRFREEIPVFLP